MRAGAGGLQYGFIQLSARISQDVLLDLRGRIFRHAQALSLDFHERYTSGRLISRATTDVESLRELLDEGLQELLTIVLSTVYITAMLLWLDWGLGAAALLSAVPLALLVRSFQRRSQRVYRAVHGDRRRHREVRRDHERHPAGAGVPPGAAERRRLRRAEPRATAGQRRRAPGDGALRRRLPAGRQHRGGRDRAVGCLPGRRGRLALGVLAAAVLYLRRLYDPIDRLGMFLNSYQSAAASLEKIAGLLAQRPSVPEPAKPARAAGAPRPGARAGRSSSTRSASPTAPAARCCPAST